MDPGIHYGLQRHHRPPWPRVLGTAVFSLTGGVVQSLWMTGIINAIIRTGTGQFRADFNCTLPDLNYVPLIVPCDTGGGGIAIGYFVSPLTQVSCLMKITNTTVGVDVNGVCMAILR